jgi:hypothetical protein
MNIELETSYKNLLAEFKPQFGNDDHITIYNMVKEVARKEKLLARLVGRGKDGRNTILKIVELKKRIVYLLEQNRQHLIK